MSTGMVGTFRSATPAGRAADARPVEGGRTATGGERDAARGQPDRAKDKDEAGRPARAKGRGDGKGQVIDLLA